LMSCVYQPDMSIGCIVANLIHVGLPGILSVKLLTQFSSSRPSRFCLLASSKQKHRSGLRFPTQRAQALDVGNRGQVTKYFHRATHSKY
jgi:hypothetical protein